MGACGQQLDSGFWCAKHRGRVRLEIRPPSAKLSFFVYLLFKTVNIASLLIDQPATLHPDRVAIIGGKSHVTYGALRQLAARIAKTLMRLGCGPGDRVLVSMADSPQSIAALIAALKLGAIVVPVAPETTPDKYRFYLTDTGAVFAILDRRFLANCEPEKDDLVVKVLELDADDGFPGTGSVSTWDGPEPDCYAASFDDPAFVLYTSGSTATQKPVVHRHGSVIAAIENIGRNAFGIQPTDVVLCSARLFFAFGLGFGLYLPLGIGATT